MAETSGSHGTIVVNMRVSGVMGRFRVLARPGT